MKKIMLLLVLVLTLAGCKVWMSSQYSKRLDDTATLSRIFADRVNPTCEGINCLKMNDPCDWSTVVQISEIQAETWKAFQDARDGRSE